MGFAVVADEVRALAQRSAQAARETNDKIQGAIVKTANGVQISAKVAQALNEIVTQARQVDELAAEVAHASGEQTQGIAQINNAVSQMDKVTQANAATAEESAGAAEELNAQAETMKGVVAELLALVGGVNRAASPASSPAPLFAPATPAKASKSHNGNAGAPATFSPPPSPRAMQPVNKAEIPMAGDFESF